MQRPAAEVELEAALLEVEEKLALPPGHDTDQLTVELLLGLVQADRQHQGRGHRAGAKLYQDSDWSAGSESAQEVPEHVLIFSS